MATNQMPSFDSTVFKRESDGNATGPLVLSRQQLKGISLASEENGDVGVRLLNQTTVNLHPSCTRSLLYAQQV